MADLFDPLSVKSWDLPEPPRDGAADPQPRRPRAWCPATSPSSTTRQRATAGLIITEGTQPSAVGQGYLTPPASTPPSRSPAGAASPTPCTRRAAASSCSSCTPAGSRTPTTRTASRPSRRARSPRRTRCSPPTGQQAAPGPPRPRDRRDPRRRRGVRARRPQRGRGRPRRRRGARRQRLPDPPVPRARAPTSAPTSTAAARRTAPGSPSRSTRAVAEAIGPERSASGSPRPTTSRAPPRRTRPTSRRRTPRSSRASPRSAWPTSACSPTRRWTWCSGCARSSAAC